MIHTDPSELQASPIPNPRAVSTKRLRLLEWQVFAVCMVVLAALAALAGVITSSSDTTALILIVGLFTTVVVLGVAFEGRAWRQSWRPRLLTRHHIANQPRPAV
jgi:hypothetical protein